MPTPNNKRTPGAVDNSERAAAAAAAANDLSKEPESVKLIPGERIKEHPLKTNDEKEVDHVLALLSGQEGTSSETIQYFIDKGRSLAEEGVELEKVLGQLQHDAAVANQRMASIRFELESTKQDIANWIKRPGVTPPELQPVE